MIKRKAVAYARMSSALQKEESIIRQLEMIHEYCEKNHLELVEEYVDEAMSGTNDRRDSFQRMVEDASVSEWQYIIVYKLDRLSRSVADTMLYKKKLSKYGVKILSVIEDFDENTPEGNLFNLFTMGLSEFYVKNLSRESWGGLLQNAKQCLTTGGTPPFGFEYTKDLNYIINEHEAKAVRLVFQRVIEDKSYKDIARELNSLGYKTKFGNSFRGIFTDMLRNRKYIGEYVFNRSAKKNPDGSRNNHKKKYESEIIRIPGGIPRIVDDDTFNQVQKILNKRVGYGRHRSDRSKYLLAGMIRCGKCGYSISAATNYGGRDKKPRLYYQCRKKVLDKECSTRAINGERLEKYIWDIAKALVKTKNLSKVTNLVNSELTKHKEIFETEVNKINERIEEYAKEVKILTEKATSFRSSADKVLNEQLNELMEEINKLKDKKLEYVEDLEKMNGLLQKNIKQKQDYLRELSQKNKTKKRFIKQIIYKIIQTSEFVDVQIRINSFIPYVLHNDIKHSIKEIRDNIAYKHKFKQLKKYMED